MISFLVNLQVPSFIIGKAHSFFSFFREFIGLFFYSTRFFIREERVVLCPCKASFLSWWGPLSLEFVITLAKHLIYKKYSYVPPNDLSEMLPLFIDRHCVRNKQAIILLCSINSYMLRDHICNAKCTNLECMCFHCTAALGGEGSPVRILEHFPIS